MAKINNDEIINLVGMKLGNARVAKRGKQVFLVPASHGPIKNDRHTRQMRSRLPFNAVRLLWSPLSEALEGNFELKAKGQLDYHYFLKLNSGCGVFFTKREQGEKCRVVTPVLFAEGTLAPIGQQLDEQQRVVTDICLGDLEVTPETAIADFATAVVGSNDFRLGDELVFVAAYQEVRAERPGVRAERFCVRLDNCDRRPLQAVCGAAAFASHSGCLASAPGLPAGCYGYCRIGTEQGQRKVSTQRLLNNNGEMLSRYTSREKFDEACESYGGCHDDYLASGKFEPLVY